MICPLCKDEMTVEFRILIDDWFSDETTEEEIISQKQKIDKRYICYECSIIKEEEEE